MDHLEVEPLDEQQISAYNSKLEQFNSQFAETKTLLEENDQDYKVFHDDGDRGRDRETGVFIVENIDLFTQFMHELSQSQLEKAIDFFEEYIRRCDDRLLYHLALGLNDSFSRVIRALLISEHYALSGVYICSNLLDNEDSEEENDKDNAWRVRYLEDKGLIKLLQMISEDAEQRWPLVTIRKAREVLEDQYL